MSAADINPIHFEGNLTKTAEKKAEPETVFPIRLG
jgi:hypothetical protein